MRNKIPIVKGPRRDKRVSVERIPHQLNITPKVTAKSHHTHICSAQNLETHVSFGSPSSIYPSIGHLYSLSLPYSSTCLLAPVASSRGCSASRQLW